MERGAIIAATVSVLVGIVVIVGGLGFFLLDTPDSPSTSNAKRKQHKQHKQVIDRGKAARNKEQQPSTHAPLPKGDTLEVYYKTTGGAGYEAYAGADGIKQPLYFTGPHYGDEHILYHADHNPGMTIDVTRMTVSGAVEVTVVHDGKQIAHAVADDSNRNVTIMGTPHDLTVQ